MGVQRGVIGVGGVSSIGVSGLGWGGAPRGPHGPHEPIWVHIPCCLQFSDSFVNSFYRFDIVYIRIWQFFICFYLILYDVNYIFNYVIVIFIDCKHHLILFKHHFNLFAQPF